uniref:Putative secreted protein n=1 Tax=Amblyomma cajennense TaxID=34607 RepID=A0A023FLP2_AMBCJ
MAYLRQAVFFAALVGACWAHKDGAPASACATMIPQHNDSKHEEAGPSTPYTLVQDKKDFKAGDTVAVTLSGAPFKGFFIKAFDDKNKEIGQFEASGESKPVTECSAVTHTNPNDKTAVKVIWKAPAGASGQVQFRATVVENYQKYIIGLHSTVA